MHALTGAVWRDTRDIAEDEVIADCLEAAGFDRGLAASGMLAGAEQYTRNTEDAISAGVFGAPFYIVDGTEKFWGQDRIEDLDLFLCRQALIETWGDGRAVLCLHCSLARGRAWAGVAKHLRGWRVIAPDLPGHGAGADADTARDFHDQATEAVTCSLPEEPAPIIGHSFGATVALRLAIERPGQVSALVLYEPVLFRRGGRWTGAAANGGTRQYRRSAVQGAEGSGA